MSPWISSLRAGISPRKLLKEHKFTLLAFFIPFFMMWLAYATRMIYPFGDRNLLTIDLYHQYAPFIAELQDKLRSGESLFYSWAGGLGTNFYALFAYYLASPLNMLTVLFPSSMLTEAILFLTLTKIGLAGAFFYRFIRGTYGREGHYGVAFACMYALSSYVLAYSWNIMWLDGIYLLPLIMLGLVRLLRDDRYLLYTLSLALMIASNYYIAFFVCLFTALYFPVLLLRYQSVKRPVNLLKKTGQFAFFSMLGGGLASLMLLPTYFSLQLTSAAGDKFPTTVTHYFEMFDYLGQHLMLNQPTIRDGMPNMYAGLLVLILLPVYFLSKKICLREKLSHIVLILFMILSFNINTLNFIWHGMHFPNQLPYRNSFVYIFMLLAMLYPAVSMLKELTGRFIGAICLGLMLMTLLGQKLDDKPPTVQSIYVTILFLAIYAAVLTLDRSRKLGRKDMARAVLLLVTAELLVSTLLTVHTIDKTEYYSKRDGYASGTQVEAIRDQIAKIEKDEENIFYRLEVMPPKTTNDAYLYRYNGLSIFSSTAAEAPVKMFENLGYHSNGINSYKYEGSTIVLDSLFGLKYLIRRSGDLNDQIRQMISQDDQITVYRNPYALPIGYMGTNAMETWSSAPGNPLEAQNNLVQSLGGLPEVMMPLTIAEGEHNNFTVKNPGASTVRYSRPNSDQESTARIKLNNTQDQTLYAYLKVTANQPKEGYFLIDGERLSFNARRSTLVELGHVKADADIELNLLFPSTAPKESQFELYAYALDQQAFEQSIDLIRLQSMEVSTFKAGRVEGSVNASRDGVFVMTMPFDTGWKATIDGKEADTFAINDGMLGIKLSAGSHDIKLKYTPPWFIKGLLISLGSALLLLILYRLPFGPGRKKDFGLPLIFKEWQIQQTPDEPVQAAAAEDSYIRPVRLAEAYYAKADDSLHTAYSAGDSAAEDISMTLAGEDSPGAKDSAVSPSASDSDQPEDDEETMSSKDLSEGS